MTDLQELIERLEKAAGPDCQLDEAIACFIAPTHPKHGNPIGTLYPKKFTASIDAALTLVPDGCVWALNFASMVTIIKPTNDPVLGILHGRTVGQWPIDQDESERDVTPAIAICIAALKARAALFGRE